MSKVILNDVVNLIDTNTAAATINDNSATIESAFDNTFSLDGTAPNTIQCDIDMNSRQIYNLPAPSSVNSPARVIDVVTNPTIVIPGTGTSGHVVPYLDGNNVFSGNNTHTQSETFNGPVAINHDTTLTGSLSATSVGASNITASSAISFPNNSVTNSWLTNGSANTVKGTIAGSGTVDLTATQLTTIPNTFTSSLKGLTPASGGGSVNVLHADGSWSSPTTVLIETLSPSAVSSIASTVTWTNAYSKYQIFFDLVTSATSFLECQVHSSGSYQTTTYLSSSSVFSTSWGSSSNPTTYLPIAQLTTASTPVSGDFMCYNPSGTSNIKSWKGTSNVIQAGINYYMIFGGVWNGGNTAIDGIKILVGSGTFTGTVKIYGII